MKFAKKIVAAVTAFSMLGGYGVTAGAEAYSEHSALSSSRSVRVNSRDWSKYTTSTAKARLSTAERTFYERLDAECSQYLTGTYDAEYIDGKFSTGYISFGDLGLSSYEAIEVEKWFKRNNPQYYFITTNTPYYSDRLRIEFQDFAVDGEERAEITNKMFNKLDSWIAECSDEPTLWQKIIAINRKICESTKYDSRVSAGEDTYAEGKNQSMYSVLMSEETVCSGYALTFSAMAHALGIDSLRAYNQNHAWNAVKFNDGKYYFVDVTWNDLDDDKYYSRYMEKYIGFGTDSATVFDNDSSSIGSHDFSNPVERWLPSISKDDYKVTASDRNSRLYAPELNVLKTNDDHVRFWWDAVNSAASYELQISYVKDFSHIGAQRTFTASEMREINYNMPQDNGTYYARIRSVDSNGNKSEWATNSYNSNNSVITEPKTPRNAKGALNADGSGVTFTWDSVNGAEGYQVQIAYNSNFTNSIERTVSKNENSISAEVPDNVGVVYFRVRTVKNGKYSDWKSAMVETGNVQFPQGDVDGNGKTNTKDATMILKYVVELITLTSEEYARADVNNDGHINSKDATAVLKIVVGLPV